MQIVIEFILGYSFQIVIAYVVDRNLAKEQGLKYRGNATFYQPPYTRKSIYI